MHMNSVPQHLHSEDRQEYERILDEALRSAPTRPELAAVGKRLNPEQLRTMALNATALITAAAATEYQHYVKVREELRRPASSTPSAVHEPDSVEPGGVGAMGLATTLGEAAEGAGAVAVAAVLTPVLAGTAAAIFLLVGYILKMLSPEPAFAKTMLTAGWVFGAMTAAAILVAIVGLLLTALRNRPSLDTGPYGESGGEVARARDAWHDALLERGILPFLRGGARGAEHGTTPPYDAHGAQSHAEPRLRPPGLLQPGRRPGAGSPPELLQPGLLQPGFRGPEHQPE